MSRVYSSLLWDVPSVSGPTELGGPGPGQTWVVRTAILTYGSYAGFFRGALGLAEGGPWQWLWATGSDSIIGISHASMTWNGRYVVPYGLSVWAQCSDSDTADFFASGFILED